MPRKIGRCKLRHSCVPGSTPPGKVMAVALALVSSPARARSDSASFLSISATRSRKRASPAANAAPFGAEVTGAGALRLAPSGGAAGSVPPTKFFDGPNTPEMPADVRWDR